MTVAQMHTEVKIGVDKVDSFSTANLDPEEIDVFLNNEQGEFIEQRAYGNNVKETGLEENQKRRDDLREITKNYTSAAFTNTTNNKTNGVFVDLPTDYRHSMQEEAVISFTDCNGNTASKGIPITPVTHDRYNKIIDDPFNKPYDGEAIRLDYEGDVYELITDGTYAITSYSLRYLKEPQVIRLGTKYQVQTTDVDCELAPHTHREIVAMTVTNILQTIESNRYPTSKVELAEVE
jgi:hypothetical protein